MRSEEGSDARSLLSLQSFFLLELSTRSDQRNSQLHGFLVSGIQRSNGAIGIVSDQKSSSTGSIPVSPNRHGSTREQSSHLSQSELVSWCAWPGVKSIARWAQKPSPCGARFLIRENPNCTIHTHSPDRFDCLNPLRQMVSMLMYWFYEYNKNTTHYTQ